MPTQEMAPKVVLKKSGVALKTAATVANKEMEKKLAKAVKMPMAAQKSGASGEQKKVVPTVAEAKAKNRKRKISGEQKKVIPTRVEVEVETKAKNRKRKNSRESYKCYVFKMLKQVHADVGISSKAMAIMDSFINDFFDNLVNEAWKLAKHAKMNTITSREIQAAAKLLIPGEMSKHAAWEGNKAVGKFLA